MLSYLGCRRDEENGLDSARVLAPPLMATPPLFAFQALVGCCVLKRRRTIFYNEEGLPPLSSILSFQKLLLRLAILAENQRCFPFEQLFCQPPLTLNV